MKAFDPVKTLLAVLIFITGAVSGYSQPCGFDLRHQELIKTNTQYKKFLTESEAKVKALLANRDFMNVQVPVYTIPVVVHVIHNGEAVGTGTNISDAQIQSAITSLTQYYRGTLGTSMDAEVDFQLATLDPNCNPTTGIVRVNGSSVTNYSTQGLTVAPSPSNEVAVKNLSNWPNHYYNIWVVSEINDNGGGGGIQGFAYFAGAPASIDGTVILASSFGYDPGGSIGYGLKSYTNLNTTLAHEMGHAFGLYHTFEGQLADTTGDGLPECPVNTSCSANGDLVCDTDPHVQSNSNCPGGTNACTGNPNANIVRNFMDYSSEACKTNFSNGQVSRLRAYLVANRPALTSSYGVNTSSPLSPFVPPVAATFTPTTINLGAGNVAGIYNVTLNQRTRPSGLTADDGGYVNGVNSCLNLIQLFQGTTYSLSAKLRGYYDTQFGVWIDYNNDGDFNDVNEQVLISNDIPGTGTSQNLVLSGSFTVPAGVPLNTPVRMRVVDDLSIYYGMPPIAWNANTEYGQAEDYPVYFSAILPVVLQNFSGELKDNHVNLQWSTSSEKNNKGFDVERSYDGIRFSKVAFVPAASSAGTGPWKYAFKDNQIPNEHNYYRLKQIDIDNKIQYSNVVYIKSPVFIKGAFKVLNNPFNNYIDLAFQNIPNGKMEIRLTDLAGREVFRKTGLTSSISRVRVDLSDKSLLKGIYFIEVSANGQKHIQKLLKY